VMRIGMTFGSSTKAAGVKYTPLSPGSKRPLYGLVRIS